MQFPMHGIVLHLLTLHKHEQKHGRLETSGELQFARASPSLSGIEKANLRNIRRSKHPPQGT